MGLNICLYRVIPDEQVEQADNRFDSTRFSGDVEFWLWMRSQKDARSCPYENAAWPGYQMDRVYYSRPGDIQAAREWASSNVECPDRLLMLMDLLEGDGDLWLYGSW